MKHVLRGAALGLMVAPLALISSAGAANGHASAQAVCPGPVFAATRCHAQVVTDATGNPNATTSPTGYGPDQFHGAYGLPTTAPGVRTVAIVDAFDDPTAQSDLNTYSSTYGIPVLPTCSSPSSETQACFIKVNQSGSTGPLPRKNAGWALEIALDVETAHAICQNCKILLVEANNNQFASLAAAEDTAASLGAEVISNSYGGSEFSSETSATYDGQFNHPGVAITVSSGDSGYGVEYPAASRYVTAVGGTTLNLSGNTRTSETTWSGSGSGCSAYESKPGWQTDTGCARRTVADVSADADPATGASVYDTTRYQGQAGWFQVGGTSLSAPLIGGVYALGTLPVTDGSYPYSHAGSLFDIVSGSNGNCGGSYLCTATTGYDGPTGLGSPNGTGGF